MSTRLLLEGGDLAELMVHVRDEFGPTARIVRAERIRSGGVAGFFARERYELTIEVPETPLPRPRALRQAPAGPVGIDALLAAAEAAEADDAPVFSGSEPAAWPTPPSAAVTAWGQPPAEPQDDQPRVSTGEETFASVLEQVRAMTGGHAMPADVEVPAPEARVFEPLVPAPAPAPAAPTGPPASPVPPGPPAAGRGGSRGALRRLGVPARLLSEGPEDDPAPLSQVLAHIPAAPGLIRTPGTVVVVVGSGPDAAAVAAQVSERLRQSPTGVVLAGEVEAVAGRGRRLTTATAAERWRSRAGEQTEVSVVALGVGPEAESRPAAAALLAALEPDQVWGVVDAREKARDCERWLEEVGGERGMDVLAVRGLFETTEPGTVLDLPVPVGWIDGVPATPVAWAAALSLHLGPGARWD